MPTEAMFLMSVFRVARGSTAERMMISRFVNLMWRLSRVCVCSSADRAPPRSALPLFNCMKGKERRLQEPVGVSGENGFKMYYYWQQGAGGGRLP